MAHWFDELSKRVAASDHAISNQRAHPPIAPGDGDPRLAQSSLSRRSLFAGASVSTLGAILGMRGLRFLSLLPAEAKPSASEFKLHSSCPKETECQVKADADNRQYVKDACGDFFPGGADTDGEDGFKLGCIAVASARDISRQLDCQKICPCPQPLTGCNEHCVNLLTDSHNCGACAKQCPTGNGCCNGECIDVQTDPLNCGKCGHVCVGSSCQNGQCKTCPRYQVYDPDTKMCVSACKGRALGPDACPCLPDRQTCNGPDDFYCTDLSSNSGDCGSCAHQCVRDNGDGTSQAGTCQGGQCVYPN
jgi:hypothetical protein